MQDWFISPGGSEEVAIEIAGLLPDSEIITSFMDEEYRLRLAGHTLRTWPFQRMPGASGRHRSFLPMYPIWFGAYDLRDRDLVVSSSSAFAKAVRTGPNATHIAYVHAPMRYAWDLDRYITGSSVSLMGRLGSRAMRPLLRRWDRITAQRPDVLVANSSAVRDRIRRVWNRDAEIIHPPVRIADIETSVMDDGYLLVASRLLAYRRIDLLVAAAARLDRELVVVGDGPEQARLRAIAGRKTRLVGRVSRSTLVDLLMRCHAYVVPGEEDFGMAPVEAMAAGKPVIAFGAGGALDTVVDGTTGTFFEEPTTEALTEAIVSADRLTFDPMVIRANAERFAPPTFHRKFVDLFRRHGVDPRLYREPRDAPR